MKPVEISFATYNRLDLTKQMVLSLYQSTNVPFNLTVVDNASSDETVSFLKENIKTSQFCKNINLILNSENMGIGYARNQGLSLGMKSAPKYFYTLDNDVEMHLGWLEESVEIMDKNPKYCIGVNMEQNQFPLITLNGCNFLEKIQGNLGTAASGFSSELVKTIGFMKCYGKYSCDDSNFFFRARIAGYKMGYLKTPGFHLGEHEVGKYRDWKTACHEKTVPAFVQDCQDYISGRQSIYIPFEGC